MRETTTQNNGGFRLNLHRADRVPALLSGFVYPVPNNEAALAFKDRRRQLK
jgi:hypothetical protein